MNYTTLSLTDIKTALEDIARDAEASFGGLDARQLNWRPDANRWSVAQCFEHLMLGAAEDTLAGARPPTIWQRLPFLPGLFGRLLIQSQAPSGTRKFTAPPAARPAASDIAADVVTRFVQQQRESAARLRASDERLAGRAIMTSPFVHFMTYRVLDGWRLMVAHNRRHFEQARRVMLSSPQEKELP